MKSRGFAPIIFLFAIVGLLMLVGGGVWYYEAHNVINSTAIVTQKPIVSSSTPTSVKSMPAKPALLTEEEAIQIAATYSKTNLTEVQAWATLETSTWDVYFAPKQSANGAVISGGNSEYILNNQTGAVLSSTFGQ
jgi:hypothetical protein